MHTVGMMAQMLAQNNLPTCLNTADGVSSSLMKKLSISEMLCKQFPVSAV